MVIIAGIIIAHCPMAQVNAHTESVGNVGIEIHIGEKRVVIAKTTVWPVKPPDACRIGIVVIIAVIVIVDDYLVAIVVIDVFRGLGFNGVVLSNRPGRFLFHHLNNPDRGSFNGITGTCPDNFGGIIDVIIIAGGVLGC